MPTRPRTARASASTGSQPVRARRPAAAATARSDERRAGGLVPVVQRQAALGLVVPAHLRAGERRERHRLRVRARPELADLGDRHAARRGQHGAADAARRSALVGRHAVRREALHVLDVLVAFAQARRTSSAVTSFCRSTKALPAPAHLPERRSGDAARRLRAAQAGASGGSGTPSSAASERRGRAPRRRAAAGEPEDAARRAGGHAQPRRSGRDEGGDRLLPLGRAPSWRRERGRGRVAAGDAAGIGLERSAPPPRLRAHRHGAHARADRRPRHDAAAVHLDAERAGALGRRRGARARRRRRRTRTPAACSANTAS